MNMEKVRMNFAPHAFLYPQAGPGVNLKQNVRAALYTTWNINGRLNYDSNLLGVESCCQ